VQQKFVARDFVSHQWFSVCVARQAIFSLLISPARCSGQWLDSPLIDIVRDTGLKLEHDSADETLALVVLTSAIQDGWEDFDPSGSFFACSERGLTYRRAKTALRTGSRMVYRRSPGKEMRSVCGFSFDSLPGDA